MAFLELEVTLTAIVIGVSLRARPRTATFGATAFGAGATAVGLVFAWLVWFVAPGCLTHADLIGCTAGQVGVQGFVYVFEMALLQWAWMLGVSLIARFVAERRVTHVSG
ncbi:MAG TPA: hypothetical protein VFR33_03580 [Candidatus Dormibacteraeota bacterium]|nr:hypothetical protein [Candidatus Dormibacteraeota bacterium]